MLKLGTRSKQRKTSKYFSWTWEYESDNIVVKIKRLGKRNVYQEMIFPTKEYNRMSEVYEKVNAHLDNLDKDVDNQITKSFNEFLEFINSEQLIENY